MRPRPCGRGNMLRQTTARAPRPALNEAPALRPGKRCESSYLLRMPRSAAAASASFLTPSIASRRKGEGRPSSRPRAARPLRAVARVHAVTVALEPSPGPIPPLFCSQAADADGVQITSPRAARGTLPTPSREILREAVPRAGPRSITTTESSRSETT